MLMLGPPPPSNWVISSKPPLETVVAKSVPPGSISRVPPDLTAVEITSASNLTTASPPLTMISPVSTSSMKTKPLIT